jgi:hypothetical protein
MNGCTLFEIHLSVEECSQKTRNPFICRGVLTENQRKVS